MRTETRNTAILVVGSGIAALLALVYSVYAGRALGRAEYGVFATAVSLIAWVHIALGPINGVVARFTAQYAAEGTPGKIRTLAREVAVRVAKFGLVGLIVGAAISRPLADFWQVDGVGPLLVAFGTIYVTLLLSVARGVLRGVQSFWHYSVNIISEGLGRLLVGVLLLSLVWGATSALGAYLVALLITLVLSRYQLRRVWGACEAESLDGKAVRAFTVPMFIMMFISAGFQNIDMLFVKHHFPVAEAGMYGAAFVWARVIATLVTPFTTQILPLMTTLHTRKEALTAPFFRMCGCFLLLAAVPMAAFWLCPERVILWSFGEEYTGAASLLFVLAAARLIGYLSHMIALVGVATDRFRFLYVYVPGLVIQVLALAAWGDPLSRVVTIVLAVNTVTFLLMAAFAVFDAGYRQSAENS